MSAISSLLAGSAHTSGLLGLYTPSASGVLRTGHRGHHADEARDTQRPVTAGSPQDIGQVLRLQVLVALQARFAIVAAPVAPSAALSPAEATDQAVAQAVGQAVQSGASAAVDANPGNAVTDVRATVAQALQDVSRYMQGTGVPAADTESAAAAVMARLDAMLSAATDAAAAPGPSVVAAQATLVQKQKTSIEIHTQEGDVVKLSLRSRTLSSAGLAVATAGDGSVAGVAGVRTISSSRLSVDVEGNINADEAAAISDVLKQVETLADQFFAGNVEQAFASAAALDVHSDQLASVAVQLRFRQSYSAAALLQAPPVSAAPLPAPAPASASAPATAAAAPASFAAAADAAQPAAGSGSPGTAETAAASAADPVGVDTTSATAVAPQPVSAAQTVQSFLASLLDLAGAGSPDSSFSVSARWKLELVVAATRSLAPASQAVPAAERPGIAKLGEVVDRLATRIEAPVETPVAAP